MKVPFNKIALGRKEISSIAKIIISGKIGGNGPVGLEAENLIKRMFGVKFVLLTTSCTHSLEISMRALGIKKGDEVILPSFSFVSCANAVALTGARPVFADIEEEHLNIDPQQIKKFISKKTKAIMCVHYAGVGCRMNEIMKIADRHNLYVVEDAAQAVGSKYENRYLGTIGDVGCYSFHETKIFTCGEGGAFLTNNKKIANKAEIIREKGTNRSAFLRGEVDKYTWVDIGSSYVISEILAGMLLEQIKKLRHIINERKKIGLKYLKGLKDLKKENKIILPKFDIDGAFNWAIFYFRLHSQKQRDFVLKQLRKKGIEAAFHFVPLHLSPYARKNYGYKEGDFPVTEKAGATLIRLPIYPGLDPKKQEYIISSVRSILK